MPIIARETGAHISDLVVYEEPTARYSREEVVIEGAPKIGDLITAQDGDGVCSVANASTARSARYIAIYDHDAVPGNRYAVIARHARIRAGHVNFPDGMEDSDKQLLIDSMENHGILIRD